MRSRKGLAENDVVAFIGTVTSPSPTWPPSNSLVSPPVYHISDSSTTQTSIPAYWLPKPEHTVDSIANDLLHYTSNRAQSEDGPSWFLKHHASLGRIYAYYVQQPTQLAQSLCGVLSSMACAAADELFAPKRSIHKHEGAGTGRMWSDTTVAWTLCEKFGSAPRERVLCAVREKVEELVRGEFRALLLVICHYSYFFIITGGPLVRTDPFRFAEWGMHAYLIARLDPQDRRRVLAGAHSLDDESGESSHPERVEGARKRLLNTGLPLTFLQLAA